MPAHMSVSWSIKVLSLPLAWLFYAQGIVDPADPSWVRLIESFGLPIALVVFFVWQWYADKQRMGNRITNLEKFQEEVIVKDIEERSLLRVAINEHKEEIVEMRQEFARRPCMAAQPRQNTTV